MRVGLDHVHLFASDLPATVDFFCKMQIYDQPPKGPRGGAVHHLGIETHDLQALFSRMKARGFHFRNEVREDPRFRYVMIRGPDDLLIELFEARDPDQWQIQRLSE